MKIGLLSDTHGWINPRLYDYFESCAEVWHAGDIGDIKTADELAAFRPLRAVYGNIDNHIVRAAYPAVQNFLVDETRVIMTHIGGVPGRYEKGVRDLISLHKPDLIICGHSHIARIEYDKAGKFLFVNPGAAGRSGFHNIMTALRFSIEGKKIFDMEVIELGERGRITS